jgi:ParB family transcriptional regulator, chromosome partitioning protein
VAERRGMGRGLAAILPDAGSGEAELRELPVELIKPNPDQPRTRFDEDSLSGLASSIEASGIVQPLIVRSLSDGSYELIAGERRLRAAQKAGLARVPAVLRDQGEAERLQTALVENMVREDLNPVDEARACAALVEDLGLSKEEVGRRIGRSRSAVSNLIRLLDLPDEALTALQEGTLSEGHGRAILQARGNDARRRLARSAAKAGWSVRETEKRAKLAGQLGDGRGKGRNKALDPEVKEALAAAQDRLESVLGHEVRVRARGEELVVELRFDDIEELLGLAQRLKRQGSA